MMDFRVGFSRDVMPCDVFQYWLCTANDEATNDPTIANENGEATQCCGGSPTVVFHLYVLDI